MKLYSSLFLIFFIASISFSQENLNSLDSNGKKDGRWIVYDDVKKCVVYQGSYEHGVRNGEFISYHRNGKIKNQNIFSQGDLDGVQKSFTDNGLLIWRCFYRQGKKNGVETYFYLNGNIKTKANWVNGKLQGVLSYFDEQGNKITLLNKT